MRAAVVLTVISLSCLPPSSQAGGAAGIRPSAPESGVDGPNVTWYADDGSLVWVAPLANGAADAVAGRGPLHAPTWFPLLPSLPLGLIDGQEVALDDFGGKVLLLDFWATWCEPCVGELRWLQAFQVTERERGLAALTINMFETDEAARDFAETLGLELPIGRYSAALDKALRVRSLPTVIVVDRERRIRSRFDRHTDGTETEIAAVARSLLDEEPDSGPEIAWVVRGGGSLEVQWSRQLEASVQGLAVLPAAGPHAGQVLAVTGWQLVGYGAQGEQLQARRVGPGVDRLRVGETTTGEPVLIGFRPASDRVVPVVLEGDAAAAWKAPQPVFDLEVEVPDGEAAPTLLLATPRGPQRVGLDGNVIASRDDMGLTLQVAVAGGHRLVLARGDRLSWLDASLSTVRERELPAGSRVLVPARAPGTGFGVAPSASAVAVGSFLAGQGPQLAVARDGQLHLLSLATGHASVRVQWPDLAALAAGDLDGDGRDELIVGSGRRVTALHWPGRTVPSLP